MSPSSLRHARAQLGMSQVELAKALGVSRAAYQKWEMGRAAMKKEKLYAAIDRWAAYAKELRAETDRLRAEVKQLEKERDYALEAWRAWKSSKMMALHLTNDRLEKVREAVLRADGYQQATHRLAGLREAARLAHERDDWAEAGEPSEPADLPAEGAVAGGGCVHDQHPALYVADHIVACWSCGALREDL